MLVLTVGVCWQAWVGLRSVELSHVRRQHTRVVDRRCILDGGVAVQLGLVIPCAWTRHYCNVAARPAVPHSSSVSWHSDLRVVRVVVQMILQSHVSEELPLLPLYQQTIFLQIDWLIEHGLTSPPTQYRFYGRRFFTDHKTQPTVSKYWRNTEITQLTEKIQ